MIDWPKTTLRKGTKTPRICRDMYITNNQDGSFFRVTVKNGRQYSKVELCRHDAIKIILFHDLEETCSTVFRGCSTFRCKESTRLIKSLMRGARL